MIPLNENHHHLMCRDLDQREVGQKFEDSGTITQCPEGQFTRLRLG